MSDDTEGLGNVRRLRRNSIDAAPPAPAAPGEEDGAGQGEMTFLPYGCPVLPIGVNGDVCYYLDQLGQLRELKARDHSRLNLQQMFGRKKDLLYEFWPRKSQDKTTLGWITTGWKPELCAEALMGECGKLGVWSAEERVRGAGAWKGRDGELILHCGDELLVTAVQDDAAAEAAWARIAPGLVGGLVYPAGPPGMKPHGVAQPGGPRGPAAEMLALLETWNWRRKDIDAHLLLGWIGAAMLGGALGWRVVAWITGGAGTGKSTLAEILQWVMGDNGLLRTSDSSAAGIRQTLKYASRPVALDESESDEDNRKMQALIKLARDAASGSIGYRGGQDHEASAFTVRSCFMFSSILIPPLLSQDRSRMAVLELDKLREGVPAPSTTERKIAELGTKLLRRLLMQWRRFPGTLEAYRAAMATAGHSARGQDVFGTLLACADLLLADELPETDVLAGWTQRLEASKLAEIEGTMSDENACLAYLLSTQIDNSRDRVRQTLGQWIAAAAGTGDPAWTTEEFNALKATVRNAEKLLLDYGIKLVTDLGTGIQYLAIANIHRGLSKIFENTQWGARPGTQGVWVQSLRRLPHLRDNKTYWFGSQSKATLIELKLCLEASIEDAPPATPAPEPNDRPEPDDPADWSYPG
jgi:hypothetical protein